MQILETERTYLRKIALEDIDNIMQIFQDPEAMKYSPAETTQTRSDAEDFIQWNIQNYEKHRLGAWAVISKSDEKYIGQAGITPHDIGHEIFYSFVRKFWGQGFATEVASACRDYAFDQLNETKLIAVIHPNNAKAIRVASKLGMHDAGEIEFFGRANRLFEIHSNA